MFGIAVPSANALTKCMDVNQRKKNFVTVKNPNCLLEI